jgi:hypothetical protein
MHDLKAIKAKKRAVCRANFSIETEGFLQRKVAS